MNDYCTLINVGFIKDTNNVGTYCDFIIAFLIAFFLNWIGYITTFCINNRIATRWGGLSGFGLSIIKIALIVQYINKTDGNVQDDSLLILYMIVIGIVLFIYGVYRYFTAIN